jgi:hypothetical protein
MAMTVSISSGTAAARTTCPLLRMGPGGAEAHRVKPGPSWTGLTRMQERRQPMHSDAGQPEG